MSRPAMRRQDQTAKTLGDAINAAVMAEMRLGADPVFVLQCLGTMAGGYANGMISGCSAVPEAVHAILDRAVVFGLTASARPPAPGAGAAS